MVPPAILDRFHGVQANAGGWRALCPAHEDKNPSLSINEKDGKLLFYCHRGCNTRDVLAAVGLTFSDLNGTPQRKEVAQYDYLDETGDTLFQVVRYHPKDFRQRRPDGSGGWTPNLNGTRRVIYNLPAVIAAELVYVVEGEKDVETAKGLGIVATCNPSGAGKWKDEYSEFLKGKNVVIIADKDAPGRKHAREVAASLHLKAFSIKVVEMPSPSKDLSEFVQSVGAACKTSDLQRLIVALAEDAPEWKPDTPEPEENWREVFHSFAEFENSAPLSFAIEGFLQNNGATLIGGLSGHGKTLILLSIVKALLKGEGSFLWDYFAVKETASRALYLIPESTIEPFKHRLCMFGLYDYLASDRLLVRTLSKGPMPCLSDPRILAAAKGAHIVLDTAVRFSAEGDENSAGDNQRGLATDIFALLGAGARTVIGAHHSPKPFASANVMHLENVLRGSGDIGAMVATAFGIKQIDREQNLIHVENIKPRDFEPPLPFQLIGRPSIDRTGDLALYKKPGECGSLQDEQQPYREKGGAPKSKEREDRLGMVARWLADDPEQTHDDLIQRFKDAGIEVSYATVRRYRNACGRSN